MVDEITSLPVSPLRITVRPSRLQDELDFADRLAGLPVEQPSSLVSVPPTYGVPYSGTLPVKVNKAIEQTWPVRMVQSGVSLPKDVYEGKIDPLSDEGIQRTQDLAGLGVVGPLAMKPGTATLGSGMTRNSKMAKDIHGNELTDYHGNPIPVGPDGKITMYHRTNTPEAKEAIYKTGKFKSKENTDETFFSDNLESEYGKGFGDHVVAVKIDPKYVRLNDQFPNGENHYAVPNKYLNKSVLFSDSGTPGSGIAALGNSQRAPAFYSAVEQTVKNAKITKGTADQWIGYLRNQAGVKPEELQWTGLADLPAGKLISKAELEQHIAENKVQLKEVQKGGEIKKGWLDRGEDINAPTKYSKYQLPGGSNYKETLLTLPQKGAKSGEARYNELNQIADRRNLTEAESSEMVALERSLSGQSNQSVGDTFRSSHWDEPNVLAHIRHNDREIPGIGKSLHIEEIQSDAHQTGRKSGYKDPAKLEALKIEHDRVYELKIKAQKEDNQVKAKEYEDRQLQIIDEMNRLHAAVVPDMPFKKTWDELALKNMIRKAAEDGYDSISWTPGEAQAARYDLSKHIIELHYNPDTHKLIARNKGQDVINENSVPPAKLPDFIGKEAAEKLMKQEPNVNGLRSLRDQELKVGGEGMKSFYDKMLVDKANAIAKKFGGKVEEKELPPTAFDAKNQNMMRGKGQPVHVLRITPELRNHALTKGFPLFSSGLPIITPVAHDPFKHKLTPISYNPFENPDAT